MKYHLVKIGALLGAATLVGLSMGPAAAAAPVSQASANGLTIGIAGSPLSSGTVKATNDGTAETKTGQKNPPIDVLDNQLLLNLGAVAQDAAARVENKNGVSRACSGVAGEGASIAEVGDANCLTPGQPVDISIANLDLTGLVVADPEGALEPINGITQPLVDALVAPLTVAITDALEPLATTGLGGTLGAVQSRCVANPVAASGTANIAETALTLDVLGEQVELVNFQASPPPNTHVLTDLNVVADVIIDALEEDLNTTLNQLGGLPPLLADLLDDLQNQIIDALLDEIAPQLAPLEENILDITLNKQATSHGGKRIDITALDLQLLPAATQFGQPPLVTAALGTVSCGPNESLDGPDGPNNPDGPNVPEGPDGPSGPGGPDVPTTVDAGASGSGSGFNEAALVGGLLMLGGAAGLIGYRRLLGR